MSFSPCHLEEPRTVGLLKTMERHIEVEDYSLLVLTVYALCAFENIRRGVEL